MGGVILLLMIIVVLCIVILCTRRSQSEKIVSYSKTRLNTNVTIDNNQSYTILSCEVIMGENRLTASMATI